MTKRRDLLTWTALAAAAATVAACEPRHDRPPAEGWHGYEYRLPEPYDFTMGGGTAGAFRLMASGTFDSRTGCALTVNAFGSLPRPLPLRFLVLPGRVWVRVDGDLTRHVPGWKPQYANSWLSLEPAFLPPSIVALTSLSSDPTGISAVFAGMTDKHQVARPTHGPASLESEVDPAWRAGAALEPTFYQGRLDLDAIAPPITKIVPAMWRPDSGGQPVVTIDLEYSLTGRPSLLCYPGTEAARSWYGVIIDRYYDQAALQPPESIGGAVSAEAMSSIMEAAGLPFDA